MFHDRSVHDPSSIGDRERSEVRSAGFWILDSGFWILGHVSDSVLMQQAGAGAGPPRLAYLGPGQR
ncbi:hypothetical protein BO71DRAFT_396372 [Aspergillus ellipticus CBS 707.79]|uniref:Uncharacterized protein n=1 Tax=Aspergillus ellipticus CBS 707.79 TaxID=1448320 RepID=A0A319E0H8_9EURO|nr:hypothetical protein BO71DRAFT_396372 [Aspergillus ellipticus CBS 707.79]